MEEVQELLPQKAAVVFTIGTTANPTITDTSSDTVTVKLTQYDVTGASNISVGTATGAVAGTAFSVTLDLTTVGIAPGYWILEAVGDIAGANPKTLIPNTTASIPYIVSIFTVNSIA